MDKLGEGTSVQSQLPEAATSDSTSKNNADLCQEGISLPATPDPHDDKKELAHEPNSLETNQRSDRSSAGSEAAGYQDLRERFTTIETKINLVDSLLGLQHVGDQTADDSDTSSDSFDSDFENVFLNRNFFRDTLFFMSQARRSYTMLQRLKKERKSRMRAAKLTSQSIYIGKFELEFARQISTAAFLKGEPATITWVDWDLFVIRKDKLEKYIMAPIDAVTGEPEPRIILQLTSRVIKNPISRTKPLSNRPTDRVISSEDFPGQGPLPERVRFHSGALYDIFSQRIADHRNWEVALDSSLVFLRPFREFIYYEKQLRVYLADLEKRFENYDGNDSKPSSVPKTDRTTVPLEDTVTENGGQKSALLGKNDVQKEAEHDDKREESDKSGESDKRGDEDEDKVEDEDEDEKTSTSITALLHLRCLMRFIDDEIKPKLEYISSDKCRKILFHDLWHLFKPGNEVVDQTEKQAYRIIRVQIPGHKVEDPWLRWSRKRSNDNDVDDANDEIPVTVHCAYIDFDGKQFGPVSKKFNIAPFGGLKDIKSLPVYPLRFARDTQLRQILIKRGKMLLDVAKYKPMYYMGFTLDTRDEIDSQVVVDFSEALTDEERIEWAPKIESLRTAPDERDNDLCRSACCLNEAVREDEYIDESLTENFIKSLIPDASFRAPSLILAPRTPEETQVGSEDEPTDEEFVVMTFRVFAFVLRSRKWAQLDLTFLRYENTDARNSTLSAFERLELPDGHRTMIRSLVTQHFRDRQAAFTRDEQTDLIRGKGKGLILLLHGAPGVGKTTTAGLDSPCINKLGIITDFRTEGVAEQFQKPLFQITCGDLGATARDVETELEKNFALASRWGCILLLDEADVFLSARERKDFERNGLVAVFLRVLEYYTGILFLTTNRIGDFDEAFASRIHMSLYYPQLDETKTKKVFKLNLDLINERFKHQRRKITYDVSSIEAFAEQHFQEHKYNRWNGRQIRNACQTALALAEFDAHGGNTRAGIDTSVVVELQLKHFRLVQTAYLEFGRYLGDIRGTEGDRRAFDHGLRARTDTPYQTTPSRFSARRDELRTGFNDGRHSSSMSESYYPAQGDPFQPLVNQSYPAAPSSNMRPTYGQYPKQGQPMRSMGNPGSGEYETQQGFSHFGNQQSQIDPRLYQAHQAQQAPQMVFNQQGQSWGSSNLGMEYSSTAQPPQGQPPQGQPPQGQPPQGQPPQGQSLQVPYSQGQSQYGYGNMQPSVGTENYTISGADSSMQTSLSGRLSVEPGGSD